ncbi:MAG: hypothetical protein KGY80_14500, partial [Candidatus Thorarchaeota archaeon]|nr:hypothetical protein [Candidatus Thorarchaeota archaeon]
MRLKRGKMGPLVLFLILAFGPTTAVANQLPTSNSATLVIGDNTITFNGWDLNNRGLGRHIIQADNWDEYQPIVDAFNDSLLFGLDTNLNGYGTFSGLNSTHFTQLLFNWTDEFDTIVELSVNSSSYLRESLKTGIASLLAFNESSDFCFRPFSEDNLLIPFLWDRSHTGDSLAMGDFASARFENETASCLLNESHWEFTLKINTTIVCYPSPTEPVYSVAQLLCIVSISLDGTI